MRSTPEHRKHIAEMPSRKSGYWGLHRQLIIRDTPDWVWRLYWALQPLRCLLGFHHWYDVAAGEAVNCGACPRGSAPYHEHLMHEYRWRPWMRRLAAEAEEAEFRARFWQSEALRYPKGIVADDGFDEPLS